MMSDLNENNQIASFLVSAPLYRPTEIEAEKYVEKFPNGSPYLLLPSSVKRECVSCGAILSWNGPSSHSDRQIRPRSLHAVTYSCRNCEATFSAWMVWAYVKDKVILEKYGHTPKYEVNPPQKP
jgi:hypothetical protein